MLFSLAACALAGCASGPALPKRAALESASTSGSATDFRETVAAADIVYFPSERTASGGRSEPAALVLEAFQNSGAPFAIAWDAIGAREQPLLDALATQAQREEAVARIEIAGTGRAREHCRAVLNDDRLRSIRHLALRLPDSAVAGAEPPMTMRFRAPVEGMELFAERMSAAEALSGRDVATAYRAEVMQQQFAAEQIVRYFQSGVGGKLLVFLRAADLENGQGVPFYVAQKLQLRQVVLGPNANQSRAKLLTEAAGLRRFQVVDRAPVSTRD